MSTSRLIRPAAARLLSLVTAGSLVLLATAPAASSAAQPDDTGMQAPTEATLLPVLGLAPLALMAEEGISIDRGVTVDGGRNRRPLRE